MDLVLVPREMEEWPGSMVTNALWARDCGVKFGELKHFELQRRSNNELCNEAKTQIELRDAEGIHFLSMVLGVFQCSYMTFCFPIWNVQCLELMLSSLDQTSTFNSLI